MLKKIILFSFVSLVISSFALAPLSVLAQDSVPLVRCGTTRTPIVEEIVDGRKVQSGGEIENPCDFDDLLEMVNRIMNFILFVLAVPIAAIMFAYAGILLLTSGGEASARNKAKTIFLHVAIGLIVAVAAWLIIHTIIDLLGYNGAWIGF